MLLDSAIFDDFAYCISTVVYLLASPTQDLCSNPGYQSKGNYVPLRWCGSWGSSPTLGTTTRGCRTLFFGGASSWNHETLGHEMDAALFLLRRLFLLIGGKWGIKWKLVMSFVHSNSWPLIERPTTHSKWPPPWRRQICVGVWWRQRELSKGHRLD